MCIDKNERQNSFKINDQTNNFRLELIKYNNPVFRVYRKLLILRMSFLPQKLLEGFRGKKVSKKGKVPKLEKLNHP